MNEANDSDPRAGFFEFGGRRIALQGTSGPAATPPRTAEGTPIRHDIVIAEVHSGELRPIGHKAAAVFEFAGRQFPLQGTSGPAVTPPRFAEGEPVRHDVAIADRAGQTTEGGRFESRAAGQSDTQPAPRQPGPTAPTGSGQLIGGPVRLA